MVGCVGFAPEKLEQDFMRRHLHDSRNPSEDDLSWRVMFFWGRSRLTLDATS